MRTPYPNELRITNRETYSNELMHHGIKGQKWGIRRYQNPDGTLTAAGRKRYGILQKDVQGYANKHAELERVTRAITEGSKPGTKIIVPSDVKTEYARMVREFTNATNVMNKKYSEVISEVVTMDDGYDYVYSLVYDKDFGSAYELFTLVGKAKKG